MTAQIRLEVPPDWYQEFPDSLPAEPNRVNCNGTEMFGNKAFPTHPATTLVIAYQAHL
jgi:hypothetical protein